MSKLCFQQLFSLIESVIYLDRGHPHTHVRTHKGEGEGSSQMRTTAYKGEGGFKEGGIYREYVCIKGAQANCVRLRTMGEGGGI